jgi:hypothetical protein
MIRVGFHLEGSTDDAVLRVLLARLIGVEPAALVVELSLVRVRGIGQLFASLPTAEDVETIAVPIAERADLDSLRARSRSFALFAERVLQRRDTILAP